MLILLGILLTVLFTAFKVLHVIAWSWWLVFLPTIITFGLPLSLVLLGFGLTIFAATLAALFQRNLSTHPRFKRSKRTISLRS